jgi:hypothetical protein
MVCHLSSELVDGTDHVPCALMASPCSELHHGQTKHSYGTLQQGYFPGLSKIDRFPKTVVVFSHSTKDQKREQLIDYPTASGAARDIV